VIFHIDLHEGSAQTYGGKESHVDNQTFEIDGLPNFLRYGAPFVRLRPAIIVLYLEIFNTPTVLRSMGYQIFQGIGLHFCTFGVQERPL